MIVYENDWYCLAEDTPVLTKRPSNRNTIFVSKIQNLQDGDLVLSVNKTGHQEWKSTVLFKRPAPNILRELRAKNQIKVTHIHKLFKPGFEIEAAGNLSEGDELFSINKLDLPNSRQEIFCTDILEEIPSWLINQNNLIGHTYHGIEILIPNRIKLSKEFGLLIGLYLAEGSLDKNVVQFALHLKEEELSDLITKCCNEVFGKDINIATSLFPKYTRRLVNIFNKTVWFLFSKFLPGDSYSKEIPYWCFDAPEDFKLGLLQGWLFGDGGLGDRNIRGTSASLLLITGMQNIALSLGVLSSLVEEGNNYRLFISGRENFEKLFPVPVVWKYYQKVKDYCTVKDTDKKYTKKQLSEIFLKNYIPGMTKKEFIAKIKMNECSFLRVFGSWFALLDYHGFAGEARRQFITKKNLIIIGWKWLKEGNTFTESNWVHDSSLPSISWITKYFGRSSIFKQALDVLSQDDFDKLNLPEDNYSDRLIPCKITLAKDVPYNKEYVYDLRVEDNANFLLGNILSHNSGSQIQVMMGDVLIDNAVAISYEVSSPKIPIYGFGSEYYRFTAQGQVLVTGSLAITFKETAYLLYPAKRYHNFVGDNVSTSPRYSDYPGTGGPSNKWSIEGTLADASMIAHDGKVVYKNIEQAFQNNKAGLVKQLSALNDSEFENWAEKFEDAIWYGSDPVNATTRDLLYSKRMSRHYGQIDETAVMEHRRLDQYPPVDIWITYGDMEAPDGVNHTVEKLLDVEFSAQTKTIQISEEPVIEVYQFIARNRV